MTNQAFKVNIAGQTYKIRNTLAPYTLSITHNYFVESVTVIRESSKFPGAHLGEISNNDIVYLGDKLTISATAVDGCTLADYITQITVKGNVKVNIQANPPATYLLGISYNTGVESVTVIRESSNFSNVPLGKLTNGSAIYQGDVLSVSATAMSGYKLLDYVSSITVSDNVNVSVEARELETYELNVSWGAGVQNVIVTRTATSKPGAAICELTNGATIYEDDILLVEARAMNNHTFADSTTDYTDTAVITDNLSVYLTATEDPETAVENELNFSLPSGDCFKILDCDDSAYLSADANIMPIWKNPISNKTYHWGSSADKDYITISSNAENTENIGAPLEIYKCNFDIDSVTGSIASDTEFYYEATDGEAEAALILNPENGYYVGTVWLDADGMWHVGYCE
jgi:hypothetical protein